MPAMPKGSFIIQEHFTVIMVTSTLLHVTVHSTGTALPNEAPATSNYQAAVYMQVSKIPAHKSVLNCSRHSFTNKLIVQYPKKTCR